MNINIKKPTVTPVSEAAAMETVAKAPKVKKPKAEKIKSVETPTGGTLNVNTATAHVSVKNADGSEQTQIIPVKDVIVTKAMANLGYSATMTRNLGNYESAKIGVTLHMPTEVKDLDATYAFITKYVDDKLNSILESLA